MGEYQDNSLGSRVFQRLREDILSGKYKEHDELRENTLGKELGVSRTPVREALRQLELEGLVTIIPNKGAYVTPEFHPRISEISISCVLCWKGCVPDGQQSILRRNSWMSWKK